MTSSPAITGIARRAEQLADMGYHLIRVRHGEKRADERWKGLRRRTRADIARLCALAEPCQWAIDAGRSGVVVLDCDDEEAAAWVAAHCPPSPMLVTTPSGGLHAYFRENRGLPLGAMVDVFGLQLDVRAGVSYAVAPEAWSREHGRRWLFAAGPVPPAELPELPAEPFRGLIRGPPAPPRRIVAVDTGDRSRLIRRAAAYLDTIEGAVSGCRGHDKTLYAACALVQKFGLTIEEAWPLFLQYNARCIPPWSERDLMRKLTEARRLKLR